MARGWYVLSVYSGYENKVEKFIRLMMESGELSAIIDVKVPTEDVTEMDGAKKKVVKRKFLPGYILLEMDLPERGWKSALANMRRIQGVIGFLGQTEGIKPQAISSEEAKSILQKAGEIKVEKSSVSRQEYQVGETVRIVDGSFATFVGSVKDVDQERGRLTVVVGVFGRDTPIDIEFTQVEHV